MARTSTRIPLFLPRDPHGPATFIHTVERCLIQRPGVLQVQIVPDANDQSQATIELDYDPDLLSLTQINGYIQQAGGNFDPSIGILTLRLSGVLTPQNEHTVQKLLNKLPGVTAIVSFASQTLRVEFDRKQCALPEIVRRLDHMGLQVDADRATTGQAVSPKRKWHLPNWLTIALSQRDLTLAIAGGCFLIAAVFVVLFDGPPPVRWAFLAISYTCCGWYLAPDVVKAMRQLHLDIDVLMLLAACGAAYLGHFEEGALLLLLFSLGNAGQRLAMNRARGAIQALAKLAPQTATVVDDQGHREVRVEDLHVGYRVLIRAGEPIPADGTVVQGDSAVDQSPITGESVPIDKTRGDTVFAGTLNGQAVLEVRVDKPSSESVLTRVIKLVEEAQTTKSPTQLFTDRVEQWYVPLVLGSTVILICLPPLLGIEPVRTPNSLWAGWFYQAMAFLTAASPCALAIGTPAAILSGIGRAAHAGVLVKGGAHLENLGQTRVIAFDKTGTLTVGHPQVTDIICLDDQVDQTRLLALAAAVEHGSQHPLALAILAEAQARDCPKLVASQIEQVVGQGIHGRVEDQHVAVGRLSILESSGNQPLETGRQYAAFDQLQSLVEEGKSTMIVAVNGKLKGAIAMIDSPRQEAAAMLDRLRSLGIRRTIMLTGDNAKTAQKITRQVGVDEYMADLLPEDKLTKIRQLDHQYGKVAMVGDGVNDAPALASATVGVAMGGASGSGSGTALETADIALLSNDLNKLPEAVVISRFTRRIIIQNLIIALGVIGFLAPLAALGQTTIYASVMFHEGSTLVVVLNALRILAYRTD